MLGPAFTKQLVFIPLIHTLTRGQPTRQTGKTCIQQWKLQEALPQSVRILSFLSLIWDGLNECMNAFGFHGFPSPAFEMLLLLPVRLHQTANGGIIECKMEIYEKRSSKIDEDLSSFFSPAAFPCEGALPPSPSLPLPTCAPPPPPTSSWLLC